MTAGTRPSEIGVILHHRQARSTGATITVERTGPGSWLEQEAGWATLDLTHGTLCMHETRALAVRMAASPEEWCFDCTMIADGKRPRVAGGKVR